MKREERIRGRVKEKTVGERKEKKKERKRERREMRRREEKRDQRGKKKKRKGRVGIWRGKDLERGRKIIHIYLPSLYKQIPECRQSAPGKISHQQKSKTEKRQKTKSECKQIEKNKTKKKQTKW